MREIVSTEYKLGFHDPENYVYKAEKGLSREVVEAISRFKNEPDWMREFRLRAYEVFLKKPVPEWGADLSPLDFDDIRYYVRPTDRAGRTWDEVPDTIKRTFEKLGIPEAEREYLAGVSTQYECLTGDTLVLCAGRAVPIKDVQPGMEVYALDEDGWRMVKRRVRGVAFKGERPVYEVDAGGRNIRCTANHPFLALTYTRRPGRQRGRFGVRWTYLRDLKPGDHVAVVKQVVDEGRPEPLPDPALIAGYVDTGGYVQAAAPYAFDSEMEGKGLVTVQRAHRLRFTDAPGVLAPHSLEVARGFEQRWRTRRFGSAHRSRSRFVDEEIGFARIRSIEAAGIEPVYDIEVEGAHNFVAQGIIVHNSEVVYHNIRKDLEEQGVIFVDTDTALRDHPDLVRRYFATVVPPADNKFAALNSAVWSGGSFIWVPEGVRVEIPLQAYFRINAKNMGQFERTLIVCEPGSSVHYVEGCSAPTYSEDSLHSAVVEIVVKEGATCRYTTIQNWSRNVYNLVTKRAVAYEGAKMYWVDGNIGSKVTMKYPAVILRGRRAHGEVVSIAVAGRGMHQDAGAKMIHAAPDTTSRIVSKSISRDGGITTYRGLVRINPGAEGARANVKCDALIMDGDSKSDTIPYMEVMEDDVAMEHEATVSKVSEEQLFYLMSRGLSEQEATRLIVAGFIEPFTRELPMEYAVELNRLLALEMEGAVG